MGLISQIEKNSHAKKIEQKISVTEISPDVQPPPLPKNFPAAPCPICRSPIFWFDRYEGDPHCLACQPPPSRALVARMDDVLTTGDNQFTWRADRAADATGGIAEPDYSGGDPGTDHEFDRRYRFYTSRDGKREIIERRDWTFLNSMITSTLE